MRALGLIVAVALLLPAPGLTAQEDPTIIFGMYLRCNQGIEGQADEVVADLFAPVLDQQVEAGRLTSWVWLTHSQGGEWRRLLATIGTDMAQMMDARADFVAEVSQDEDAMERSGAACPSHDDYVWIANITSTDNPDVVGAASVSSYHTCDRAREGRADEIFEEVLAPLYQKHIDMGHLATYGFYGHRIGGPFRRLETVSGPDHMTILTMQAAVYGEAFENHPLKMQEFSDICSSHTDYLWNNETPGT